MQKNALVLAGGGSRGSYQIGVWQALRDLSIKIDIVTGTSVGALNAALVTMGDFDNALEVWENINTAMVLEVEIDETLPVKQKMNFMIKQFLKDYVRQGGTNSYPLKQMLDKYCDEDGIRNSPMELGIVVVDKKTLKPLELYKEDIKDGQLTDYLLASSSLFPAIKCCEIDGGEYIDGGYYDNLPVELATNKGADFVIAVDLEAIGMVRKETLKQPKKIMIIKSYWDLGPLLLFDDAVIKRNIRLGYLDTMKAFNAFDGVAYTFIKNEVPAFIKRERRIIDAQGDALGLTYESKDTNKKEKMFHLNISNFLKRKYGKEFDLKFTSFIKACAESAGEIFSVNAEKIYSLSVFNEVLFENLSKIELVHTAPIEMNSIKNLKETLALFDKSVRTVYIGTLIKKAVVEGTKVDLLGLSLLLPDELLAAYYIALIS
ncbi:MAG: patatin-like phospholipase family protein [Oscillospiraceae bacterium]